MPNFPLTEQLTQRNSHYSPQSASNAPEFNLLDPTVPLSDYSELADQVSGDDWSPATQELVDALPRVWTRGLLYLLVGCAGVILPWATLSKVDQTGIARGRLEPKGRTFKLDAPVAGKVVAIDVREGGTVTAGQRLVELDSDLVRTDLQQTQAKLAGELSRVTQLEQIKNQVTIATRTQRLQSAAQTAEQLAETQEVEQRIRSLGRAYMLAQERLMQDLKEVQRYRKLWQEGVVPEIKVVELERIASESRQFLQQALSELEQAQTQLRRQQSSQQRVMRTGELAVLESEKQVQEIVAQIAGVQAEIAQTKKAIASLKLQLQQRVIQTPVSGTIFQLPIQQTGAVVQPGQTIAQIAPQGVPLVFRAEMPISESGFLQVGMPVKLKFDAYPFQDYGVISGRIRWISPDSKTTQTPQGQIETFELEIVPDQTTIQAQNKSIRLTPGQTATAEVIVRQRRIIDFVIDPFKKLQKGDLKL